MTYFLQWKTSILLTNLIIGNIRILFAGEVGFLADVQVDVPVDNIDHWKCGNL
jgi:hypothetical protein